MFLSFSVKKTENKINISHDSKKSVNKNLAVNFVLKKGQCNILFPSNIYATSHAYFLIHVLIFLYLSGT